MATTHVFIVDTRTFKIHLEYLFAGTGAKEEFIDFNENPTTSLNYQKENNLVGMIADSLRIRKGDFIVFYLQQNAQQGVFEGKFYGIFQASEDYSFLDNKDKHQYLTLELGKSLTFRTLIEPFEVFPKGVSEWEALDEIKYISSPNQMLWSLIYRKLKGNRGNTMITIYESERLFKLLRDKNQKATLPNTGFSFDDSKQEIINSPKKTYVGRQEKINIFPRLDDKYRGNKAFETHLQAYILNHVGRKTNHSLDNCLVGNLQLEWIGNEVSCGVGMQRIDIALSLLAANSRVIQAIELKATEASPTIIFQLQRYVDWITQYYLPNRISDIQPVIISKAIVEKKQSNYYDLINNLMKFNKNNTTCNPIKYIEYYINNNALFFYDCSY